MGIRERLQTELGIKNVPLFKDDIEQSQLKILAPYAVKAPKEKSRMYNEEEDRPNRSEFQRDRDRIIHSQAFRRLMYKTQVFVNHEGDHYRTRLTHSLEVAQISRGICRSLALNEDLAEAISLGHDLGHTPFGHAVENVLSNIMKDQGGFLHNEQSLRIVDVMEKRTDTYDGLNLTYEVREGILKHNKDNSEGVYLSLNPKQPCSSIEGQIVNLVDTVTYTCHDLDDGIKSGLLDYYLKKNEKMQEDFNEVKECLQESFKVLLSLEKMDEIKCIRKLIHALVLAITDNTWTVIENKNIDSVEKVLSSGSLVSLGDKIDAFKKLKDFVKKYVYGSQTITIMDEKAKRVISEIWETYNKTPNQLPINEYNKYLNAEELYTNYEGYKSSKERVICDYISTMTDRYALEIYRQLFDPNVKI